MKSSILMFSFLISSHVLFSQFGDVNYLESRAREPRNVQIGDVDGDGDNDIISAHWFYGRIGFHENLGGGRFRGTDIIDDLSGNVKSVELADLDNDGFLDILCAHAGGSRIVWYKNQGDGTFADVEVVINSISNPEEIRVVDIDVDGDKDIIVGKSGGSGSIIWYKNTGSSYVANTIAGSYWHLEIADLNGDGLLDIIGGAESVDKVAWFKNLGDDFGEENIISTGLDAPTSVHGSDINGDGIIDVVVTSKNDNKLTWFQNGGDETFGAENVVTSTAGGAINARSADFDGDGDMDIALAAHTGDQFLWFENSASGISFTEHLINTEGGAYYVAPEDLDGDGDVDIVMSSYLGDNLISWSENTGTDFGTPKRITSRTEDVTSLDANDLDGDGDIDIIATAKDYYRVAWLENLGDGKFNATDTIPVNLDEGKMVASGDIDDDGDIDIVALGKDFGFQKRIMLSENLGAGTFAPGIILAEELASPEYMTLKDMDEDGDLDLVAASSGWPLLKFAWYENDGGTFSTEHVISTSYFVRDAEYGDFDLDGDMDIIILQSIKASFLENLGDGTFADEVIIEDSFSSARDMCVLDVDVDGDLDVVLAAIPTPILSWYENDGGTFSPGVEIGDTDVKFSVTASDVNLDGKEDLVVTAIELPMISDLRQVQWFENIGDGTFGSEISLFFHEQGSNNAITADLDGDGDNEIVFGTDHSDMIGWLESYYFSDLQIKGELYTDMNLNGVKDEDESPIDFISVLSSPDADISFTFENGEYVLAYDETGIYTVEPEEIDHWSIVTDSLTYTVNVDGIVEEIDSLDFGFYPDSILTELQLDLTGSFPRCNDVVNYWVSYSNTGTTITDGVVELILDDDITFVESEVEPDSIVGQHIYWSFEELSYFEDGLINSHVLLPGVDIENDSLVSVLNIYAEDEDMEETVFSDTLLQILVCAFDPNDKQSTPIGIDSMGYIPTSTETIEYFIRFQNTGTDTAFNITITDQLDENLDWSTFDPITSSHDMTVELNTEGQITFFFENIMLPDSNVNEIASHGFVKYKINLNEGLEIGTSIYNTAAIYFDENPPVITNTKILTLYDCAAAFAGFFSMEEVCQGDVLIAHIAPELSTTTAEWNVSGELFEGTLLEWEATTGAGVTDINLTVSNGICERDTTFEVIVLPKPEPEFNMTDSIFCVDEEVIELSGTPFGGEFFGPGVTGSSFNPADVEMGTHVLYYSVAGDNGCVGTDNIQVTVSDCLGIENAEMNNVEVFPNPFDNFTTIHFGNDQSKRYTVVVHDMVGKEVYRTENNGGGSIKIWKKEIGKGVFLMSILDLDSNEVGVVKLVVQ